MGMYFCEVAEYVTMENMDTREILKLLYQSLRALKVPSLSRELVRRIYEFKLIALNGEAPRLFACIACGRKDELFYFHPQKAGILCEACYEKRTVQRTRRISHQWLDDVHITAYRGIPCENIVYIFCLRACDAGIKSGCEGLF